MPTNKKPTKREIEIAEAKERREEILNQVNKVISNLNSNLLKIKKNSQQCSLLESVSISFYNELDKLSKKSPVEEITDLMVIQANDVIKETKQLAKDDTFIQRINEFVPAGDNPETRDALIILGQIRQGLERFKKQQTSLAQNLNHNLAKAESFKFALEVFIDEEEVVNKDDFKEEKIPVYESWFEKKYPHNFDFARLEETDITQYFADSE